MLQSETTFEGKLVAKEHKQQSKGKGIPYAPLFLCDEKTKDMAGEVRIRGCLAILLLERRL
ncbi:MAG: hypothetical protein RL693_2225 [Verrucomicrobiota bacterium]|jgi:hypothetical protein